MSEDTGRASPKPPSVDRLSLLWRRVNEHKMVQWSVAYIALAYGLQHGVILTSESFEWPNAVARISMLLLALGLPVVMTFAWYHGERASQQFTKAELSILSALLVIGSLLFYAFVQPSAEVVAGPRPAVQQASLTAARAAAASPAGAISVAVLPFANVTGDGNQDFFSDGITDEISGALSKIPDLRLVARTSAFQFKGQNRDIQAIGLQLHATHLIEGSVRKAGNRVRISAELVQADNGIQVWSENYDRDLTDVFAIQEDIAKSIAASLRMPLGLKPGENLVNSRTKDEATYEDYLRAKALVRARGLQELTGATKLLEQVVARDPNFAPGWALLALGYALTPNADRVSGRPVIEAVLAKAEAAARRAIQVDPKNPEGYVTLGLIEHARGNQIAAGDALVKAMALDPTNADGLHLYSDFLADMGYLKQALPLRQEVQALEPFVPVFKIITARIMYAAGQYDEVIKAGPPYDVLSLAAKGQYREAADRLQKTRPGVPPATLDAAVRLLRSAPAIAPPQTLPQLGLGGAALNFIYVHVGAPERVMDAYEGDLKRGYGGPGDNVFLWAPAFAPVRKTARFKAYVRAAGLVDYWRKNGWPDLCRPMGADDFVCD